MKQVTLKVKNCSANQWQTLLLELYGVKQQASSGKLQEPGLNLAIVMI